MKNEDEKQSEPAPEDEIVEMIVTQEEYEERLKRGWTDDDMLKPGRYKLRRGGFLKRHPELSIDDIKSACEKVKG